MTPSPAEEMILADLYLDFSMEVGATSSAQWTSSRASSQAGGSASDSTSSYTDAISAKVRTAHRVSELREEREGIQEALKGIMRAEGTALALQSSAFSTHPQYWRAYQLSLWLRTAGVNDAWNNLHQ